MGILAHGNGATARRRRVYAAFPVLLLTIAPLPTASAQTTTAAGRPPSGDRHATAEQHHEIVQELKAIRQLLEQLAARSLPPAPAVNAAPAPDEPVQFASLPTDYVLGNPEAPVTIVEFTDLQCPFCREFSIGAFPELKRTYIDTGKVRYISRDLPLTNLHPLAVAAARASRCAGAQQKFWEMRHAILVNNAQLTPAAFATFATDLRLDAAAFAACTSQPSAFDAAVQADAAAATAASITGTPTFVIGRSKGTGVDGRRLEGALPFAVFDARIKALLDEK